MKTFIIILLALMLFALHGLPILAFYLFPTHQAWGGLYIPLFLLDILYAAGILIPYLKEDNY